MWTVLTRSFFIVWHPSANQLHLLFFSLPDFCEAKQKKRSVQIILLKFCFSCCFAILCQAHWLFRKFPVYGLFYTSTLELAQTKHLENLNLFLKKNNLWMDEVKQKTAFPAKIPFSSYKTTTTAVSTLPSFTAAIVYKLKVASLSCPPLWFHLLLAASHLNLCPTSLFSNHTD